MQNRLLDCQNREFIYALYSRIFMQEADEQLLELLETENIKEFFPNLFEWEKYNTIDKATLIAEHLNVDFTDLSLLHLIPYETFYTREDGMIESGGDNKALQFYDRFEFVVEKDKARILSPDHIAVELEFVHKLIESEKKALEAEDFNVADEFRAMQLEFIEKHLVPWAPIYFINVKNEAQTPLYHDSAMMALDFLLSDFEYLKEAHAA
jgi:TorA maturation chaperone TorD